MMDMKQIVYTLSLLSLTWLMSSCSKTKSGDDPLPVVRKEAVYIPTENNNLISYAYDSGNKLWEVHLSGYTQGTPVFYNNRLYVLTTNGNLYSIDVLNGEIAREKNIGISTSNSLCVNSGKLFIAADKLYCYDTTFTSIWNYDPGTTCSSSPTVINGRVFVGADVKCHAVDMGTGFGVWTSSPAGAAIYSSPTVSNGLVYFGSNDKKIYAVKESDGSAKWDYSTGDKVESSPIVYGGMCLVGGMDFSIYCIDTTTGTKRWSFYTPERISSSPAIHEISNSVLVGSYDFNLYALSHVDGKLKWKFPAGSLIKGSPVVHKDYVYFTAFDRYIYCVNVNSGQLVWKQFLNGNTLASPVVDDLAKGIHPGISGNSKY